MRRQNGVTTRLQTLDAEREKLKPAGGMHCLVCGKPGRRGRERPYCAEHSPYLAAMTRSKEYRSHMRWVAANKAAG